MCMSLLTYLMLPQMKRGEWEDEHDGGEGQVGEEQGDGEGQVDVTRRVGNTWGERDGEEVGRGGVDWVTREEWDKLSRERFWDE